MDALSRSRRKALKVAVGALCLEVGFGIAEESALETLTEMLQSCMFILMSNNILIETKITICGAGWHSGSV